ncbi:MAG: recombinase family protein [Snowella sp.]|nr:recombinase family protein [Snowella sp.]
MRIIGRARVSKKEQAMGQALSQQTQRLLDYGATEIISSVESRGSQLRSNDFNRLIDLIEVSTNPSELTIVVTRFDRLGTLASINKIVEAVVRRGANLVAIDQPLDLNTVMGRAFASMLGVISDIEVDGLSDRVRHGHAYHQSREAAYSPVFGYEKVGDRLKLDTDVFLWCDGKDWSIADIARYRVDLVLELGSLTKALAAYNEKFGLFPPKMNTIGRKKIFVSLGGFSNWISNPILRGHISYGRKGNVSLKSQHKLKILLNKHEPLITESEWITIEQLLTLNAKRNGNHGNSAQRPFAGLVKCPVCLRMCSSFSFKLRDGITRRYGYHCVSAKRKGYDCPNSKSVREERIRDAVVQRLVSYADQIFLSEQDSPSNLIVDPEIAGLQKELSDLTAMGSTNKTILDAIDKLKQQIQQRSLRCQLERAAGQQRKDELVEVFKDPLFWSEFVEKKLSPSEVRSYYRKWIRVIWIEGGEITGIDLNF